MLSTTHSRYRPVTVENVDDTKMTILLDAPDWVVAGGIRRVLEEAGHDVLLVDPVRLAEGVETVRLALIAVEDEQPVASNATASLCASRHVPVVWWSSANSVARLVDMPEVRTVGLLITPVHESQLLAAVTLGLSVGRATHGLAPSADGWPNATRPSVSDRYSADLETLSLTTRQRTIVEMMLDGDRVSTIAEKLEIAPATVRAHLNRVYDKLGVHSQATLVQALKARSGSHECPDPSVAL